MAMHVVPREVNLADVVDISGGLALVNSSGAILGTASPAPSAVEAKFFIVRAWRHHSRSWLGSRAD